MRRQQCVPIKESGDTKAIRKRLPPESKGEFLLNVLTHDSDDQTESYNALTEREDEPEEELNVSSSQRKKFSQKNTDFASFQENILEEKSAENGTAHLRALARENPNIKHLTCHVTIDIHKKKWTIIVSYGGATEDMKLAICFHHIYEGVLTVSISM